MNFCTLEWQLVTTDSDLRPYTTAHCPLGKLLSSYGKETDIVGLRVWQENLAPKGLNSANCCPQLVPQLGNIPYH